MIVIPSFWKQSFAVLGIFIASISAAMVYGFTAILLPQLEKPDSEIHVSTEVGSWIASAVPLLMSGSSLITAPLLERLGRRNTLIFVMFPICLGWLLIVLSHNLTMLLTARAVGGIGNGLLATAFSLYIGEVTEPKYRGFFFTSIMIANSLGVIVSHLLGAILPWRYTAAIAGSLPVVAGLGMCMVPESPYWYISKRRKLEAEAAFIWLRGGNVTAAKVELEQAWATQELVNQEKVPLRQKFKVVKEPSFYNPFIIITVAFFLIQFSGAYTVIFYSIEIFDRLTSVKVNEYVVTLAIDGLRLTTVILSSFFMRSLPRRFHILFSGIGTAVSALSIAVYVFGCRYYVGWRDYSWIVITLMAIFIFLSSFGIFTLPFCLAGELYPLRHKSFGTSMNTCFNYLMLFVSVKIAPNLFVGIGMDGTFLFYAIMCLIGSAILAVMLPETKNKTLTEIEEYFCQKSTN